MVKRTQAIIKAQGAEVVVCFHYPECALACLLTSLLICSRPLPSQGRPTHSRAPLGGFQRANSEECLLARSHLQVRGRVRGCRRGL